MYTKKSSTAKTQELNRQLAVCDMHLAAAVSWFLASDALGSTSRALVAISSRLATVDTPRSPVTTSDCTLESPDAAAALAASKPVSTKSS